MPNKQLEQWIESIDEQLCQAAVVEFIECEQLIPRTQMLSTEFEEFTLIQWLDKKGFFSGLEDVSAVLTIFAKHFLTRRILYQLREYFQNQSIRIQFELMRFRLYLLADKKGDSLLCMPADSLLSDFYGDINTLSNATEASVTQMMTDFWKRYDSYSKGSEYLDILDLDESASWPEIKAQYRRFAARNHPDKGGDPVSFTKIQQAYESLKLIHGKR